MVDPVTCTGGSGLEGAKRLFGKNKGRLQLEDGEDRESVHEFVRARGAELKVSEKGRSAQDGTGWKISLRPCEPAISGNASGWIGGWSFRRQGEAQKNLLPCRQMPTTRGVRPSCSRLLDVSSTPAANVGRRVQ